MMRAIPFIAGALAAGLASCATSQSPSDTLSDRAAARLAEFEPTGERTDCLGSRAVTQITPLTDSLFLVRTGAGQYWLNRTRGPCRNADSAFSRLEYSTSIGMLCRNQIINVVEAGSNAFLGSCGLGDFERLERKAPTAEETVSEETGA